MQPRSNQVAWVFIAGLVILLLTLLAPILTPFIFGGLLAYLMNPLVKYLEKHRVPHLLSVVAVFSLLFVGFVLVVALLFPLVQGQISALGDVVPQIVNWLENSLLPWLQEIVNINTLKTSLSASLPKAGDVMSLIANSGHRIIEWIVNIVLIPVVTFYLLRDWDLMTHSVKSILPKSIKPTVIKLAKEYDEVLSAFFRGQFLVMLSLFLIYGAGLTLAGLRVGFIIGFLGGLLSIVPYLGSLFVIVAASITALVEFGTMQSLFWVWGVYLIGQCIESWVLTPYLIGNRIGLHPVIIIFAIMAGGVLFGFFGVLVALPVAALLKVLACEIHERYTAHA